MAQVLFLASLALLAMSTAECSPAAETCTANCEETEEASLLQRPTRRDQSQEVRRSSVARGEGLHEQPTEAEWMRGRRPFPPPRPGLSNAISAVAVQVGAGPCGLGIFENVSSDATIDDVRSEFAEKCRTCKHPHPASFCEALADEAFMHFNLTASLDVEPGSLLCKSIKHLVETHIMWVKEIDASVGEKDVALIVASLDRRSLQTQNTESLDSVLSAKKLFF